MRNLYNSAAAGGGVFNKVSGRYTEFRPGSKLLASLNVCLVWIQRAHHTKCSIPEREGMEKGPPRNTINKWPKETVGNETVRVLCRYYYVFEMRRIEIIGTYRIPVTVNIYKKKKKNDNLLLVTALVIN